MKISVRVKTNAKKESVERTTQATLGLEDSQTNLIEYKVSVKEPPVAGKANMAVVKALAKYFDIAPSLISLHSGITSKLKIFEIII